MESIHSLLPADPEIKAPDFVDAVARFRSAVKEFTQAVEKLDNTIAAAIEAFGGHDATSTVLETPIPTGYHPPA